MVGGFKKRKVIFTIAVLLVAVAAPTPTSDQGPAAGTLRVALPFDLVDFLDGVKFKILVPAKWNVTSGAS